MKTNIEGDGCSPTKDMCTDPNLSKLIHPIFCGQFSEDIAEPIVVIDSSVTVIINFWGERAPLISDLKKTYRIVIQPLIPITTSLSSYLSDPTNIPTDILVALQDFTTMLYYFTGYTSDGPGPSPVSALSISSSEADFTEIQATFDSYKKDLSDMEKNLKSVFLQHCPTFKPTCPKPPSKNTCGDKNLLVVVNSIVCGQFSGDIAQTIKAVDSIVPYLIKFWNIERPLYIELLQKAYRQALPPLIPITTSMTSYLSDPSKIPPDIFSALEPIVEMLYTMTGYSASGPGPSPANALSTSSSEADFINFQAAFDSYKKGLSDMEKNLKSAFRKTCPSHTCPKAPQPTGFMSTSEDMCTDPNLLGVINPIFCGQLSGYIAEPIIAVDSSVAPIIKIGDNIQIKTVFIKLLQAQYIKTIQPLIPITTSLSSYLSDPTNIPSDILVALQDFTTMLYYFTGYTSDGPGPSPVSALSISSSEADFTEIQATFDSYKKDLSDMEKNLKSIFFKHCPTFKPTCPKPPSENTCDDKNLIGVVNSILHGQFSTEINKPIMDVEKAMPAIIKYGSKIAVQPRAVLIALLQPRYKKAIKPLIPITANFTKYLSSQPNVPSDILLSLQYIVEMLYAITGYSASGPGPSPVSLLSITASIDDYKKFQAMFVSYKTTVLSLINNLKSAFLNHCPKPPQLTMSKPIGKTPKESGVNDYVYKIFPNDLNSQSTAFGGTIVALLDRLALVVAERHSNKVCVTASIDAVQFLAPAKKGDNLIIKASINRSWRSSMEIGLRVFSEHAFSQESRHILSAYFTFVALNDWGDTAEVPTVLPETEEEVRRFKEADKRRTFRVKAKVEMDKFRKSFSKER